MSVPQRYRIRRTARGTNLGKFINRLSLGSVAAFFALGVLYQYCPLFQPFLEFNKRAFGEESEEVLERRALMSVMTLRTGDQVRRLMKGAEKIDDPNA